MAGTEVCCTSHTRTSQWEWSCVIISNCFAWAHVTSCKGGRERGGERERIEREKRVRRERACACACVCLCVCVLITKYPVLGSCGYFDYNMYWLEFTKKMHTLYLACI